MALLFLTACSVAPTYETPTLKTRLEEEMSKISDERARIQVDHEDKKTVLASIRKLPKARGSALFEQLADLERQMGEAQRMVDRRSQTLTDISGQFSALSYSRETIRPNDPEYGKAKKLIDDFESEVQRINTDIKTYSATSNEFAGLVNDKNLFRSFNVEEIDSHIREGISSINAAFLKFKSAYEHTAKNFELISSKPGRNPDNVTAMREMLEEMRSQVTLLSEKSRQLADVRNSFFEKFQDRVSVKNTDPDYEAFLKLKSEYEQAVTRLDQVEKDFTQASIRFNRLAEKN
jgi:hypothetical protein